MKILFFGLLLLNCMSQVVVAQSAPVAERLMVGTAKTNITPPDPRYPVHDSLYARSLIMEANGERIAFIALDLIGYTNITLSDQLKRQFDLTEVYFCPQHTHSAERAPREWLEKQIVSMMEEASENMFEAKISGGYRYFPQLSFNRLIMRDDGRARESWLGDDHYRAVNPERIPHGPVDPAVGVIKLEDLEGTPRVLIMNYACHPDVAWNNFEISADYVGYATRYTEEAFNNTVNCLFVQGGGGNQAPLFKDGGRTGPDDLRSSNYDLIDRMGKLLSIEAVKLAKELYPNPYDIPSIKVKADSLSFTGRYDKDLHYNVHFSVIAINDRYVIATVPGEPFIKFQIDWKREMQSQGVPFLFGYTWNGGDWPVYLPDIRSAAYGGYGADHGPNLIEVGAGEKIMMQQLENYYHATPGSYHFDATGISRPVLENYLKRSVTMTEFLAVDPYANDGPYPYKEDDVRLIKNTGAKFIGRAIYRWGREEVLIIPEYLEQAKKLAEEVHAYDPDVILQACLFEIVTQNVEKIPIPSWAFEAMGMPAENRHFRYDQMLNPDGKFVNHWREGSSVPDITRQETQLWFIFLAGTYFDIGCEALHLGQTALIGMADPDLLQWQSFIDKLRSFAKTATRRGWVLLDAHVPYGGMIVDGVSLLDFNSFPLRIKETPDKPRQAILEVGYLDALYLKSKGGKTPSGWHCQSLPYLVEFDNFGCSPTPGEATVDSHFIWGYDEITWFYLQDEAYRQAWLKYAYNWVRENDPNGFLQMPVSRLVSLCEGKGRGKYRANNKSAENPDGLNVEETIKELWSNQ